jgi:hypothetical protein
MNTHTPGPWSIDSDPYPARFHNENPPRLEDVYEITNRDAGATPAYATSEADARLIAAAPELLKALAPFADLLAPFADLLESPETAIPDRDRMVRVYVSIDDIIRARKAIAKAEGA